PDGGRSVSYGSYGPQPDLDELMQMESEMVGETADGSDGYDGSDGSNTALAGTVELDGSDGYDGSDGSNMGVLGTVRDWLARFIYPMDGRDLDLLALWIAHTHLVSETYTT